MRFLVTWLIFGSGVTLGCCQLVSDLPSDVISDILSILATGTVHLLGNCTGSKDAAPETNYWIYTSDNPGTPKIITTPSPTTCEGRPRIIFLNHGWSWDANAPYIIGLKDAYLSRYGEEVCVISVNWGAYALQNYLSSYCAAPGVAANVANFICNLKAPTETLHLVGHSMGAQIFGIAGNLVQLNCDLVLGRITGLDPAGPLYNGIALKDRLDKTDAIFVDVIHTNQGQYGYVGDCGDLDVFANCGVFQPGCVSEVFHSNVIENPSQILNLPLDYVSCNHRRSCLYFQESISSDKFLASRCDSCGFPLPICLPNIGGDRKVIGENAKSGPHKNYVFFTNKQPPYAKG